MKIALVTGGSRGIGAASAVSLASAGWNVAISYLSDAAAAESIAERCRACDVNAVAVRADVSDDAQVRDLFRAVDEELGRLTALVNNAGIALAPHQRLDEMTVERMQRVFAVNITGSFLCAREAVRRMSYLHDGDGGSIVNLSSVAARIGSPGEYLDYAASKGAIDSMTLGLSKEVATEGIRVNAVRPGVIRTDFHASAGDKGRPDRVASAIPMQRPGEPEEVANLITWLCSDEASYVTGSIVDVSGGR
jgi:NAD(P)-dependent dehydrogenase (short-subunit alcohol dehydrogenase family)